MRVWRIARVAHRRLDGDGARLWGGRWNSPGIPVVYASASLALAALEYLTHVDIRDAPDDLVAMAIDVPDEHGVSSIGPDQLSADWNRIADSGACVARGDAWVAERRTLALRVPSAVVPEECNVLINPDHPGARDVRVVSTRRFQFDPRVMRTVAASASPPRSRAGPRRSTH